jgi:hypothetical protein
VQKSAEECRRVQRGLVAEKRQWGSLVIERLELRLTQYEEELKQLEAYHLASYPQRYTRGSRRPSAYHLGLVPQGGTLEAAGGGLSLRPQGGTLEAAGEAV